MFADKVINTGKLNTYSTHRLQILEQLIQLF